MSEQEPTKVYNGVIIKDSTPVTFDLVERLNRATAALNGQGEVSIPEAIAHVESKIDEVITAMGRLELEISFLNGRATKV